MKLLLIEDNLNAVRRVKDNYEEAGWAVFTSGFDEAPIAIQEKRPDIIVMDWMDDLGDNQDRGREIFNGVHNTPIIVYSGVASALELDEISCNPFIEKIPKGDEEVVINQIDEWEKYIKVVSEIKSQFNDVLTNIMAALKPIIALDSYPGESVIKFMLTKQASEFFNSKLVDDESNPTWTQYLYPPLSSNLLVADILKSTTEDKYYVVLTPSCDMANGKVSDTLVAVCEQAENFYNPFDFKNKENAADGDDSIDSEKPEKEKDSDKKRDEKIKVIKTLLSYGYNKSKVALPCLPKVFPYLTINLKELLFISISDISLNSLEKDSQRYKYIRIASVNSPYREQIVWAHMVNSCRPGVPERDYKTWAENILKQ